MILYTYIAVDKSGGYLGQAGEIFKIIEARDSAAKHDLEELKKLFHDNIIMKPLQFESRD